MFKQVLIDGFFHADPHPANLFVDPRSGTLTFLDMGMMGRLMEEQRTELGNLVLAIQQRDARQVMRIVETIGQPYRPVEEPALHREIDRLLDRYLSASLSEISFATLTTEMLAVVFEHGIRLPTELTLGVKALVQAEEIARTLDPDIQIIEIARRIARQLVWQRLEPRAVLERLVGDVQEMIRLARGLPQATEQLMKQVQSGRLPVKLDVPELEGQVRHLTIVANRLTAGLMVAGMAIGSAIAMGVSPQEVTA